MIEYMFTDDPRALQGYRDNDRAYVTKAPSLERAIRIFRTGATFPHRYSTAPLWTKEDGVKVCRSSGPGAVVRIWTLQQVERMIDYYGNGQKRPEKVQEWVQVGEIPPEAPVGEEFSPEMQAAMGLLPGGEEGVGVTALAPADDRTGLSSATRHELEERELGLAKAVYELEQKKAELALMADRLKGELERRLGQIWLIELFLGSKERVVTLRTGVPAPAETRIAVYQRVRCMDEEMALEQWFRDPESIGQVSCEEIEVFDEWIAKPENLQALFPHPKGIMALRIRRRPKNRGDRGNDIATMLANASLAGQDLMTYLLVKNGENLHRIWVDVVMWPRFFARLSEFERPRKGEDSEIAWSIPEYRKRQIEAASKQFMGGLVALNGLLQRSDIFHPLPRPGLNALSPADVDAYFELVRDDEGDAGLLGDGRAFEGLTWDGYRKWLQKAVAVGCRVYWKGRSRSFGAEGDKEQQRRTMWAPGAHGWPRYGVPYTLEPPNPQDPKAEKYGDYRFCMMIENPGRWGYDGDGRKRRRCRFWVDPYEVLPIDLISWRVLEHLLRDPNQRERYEDFFHTAFAWWKLAKTTAEAERPFVDLVLQYTGAGEVERPRVERLIRWWKLKTREHRTLAADESKAFRMIVAAFRRGDDYEDDPERLLTDRIAARKAVVVEPMEPVVPADSIEPDEAAETGSLSFTSEE